MTKEEGGNDEVERQKQFQRQGCGCKRRQVAAKVKVDIGGEKIITSVITVEAVRDLDIKVGNEVSAIIKATSVMIGK